MTRNKIRHFYWNKYLVSPFAKQKYFLSYHFKYKALWFRVYKVATRTIDKHLREGCAKEDYIYSSEVGYHPDAYQDYFKFAFVRQPVERFISAWKDKVINQNYFHFEAGQHEELKELKNFIAWVKEQDITKCDEHLRAQYALIDVEHVDFIGRFENFAEDLHKVAQQIGMPLQNLQHLNKSGSRTIQATAAEIQAIQTIYQKDFELFYPNELS